MYYVHLEGFFLCVALPSVHVMYELNVILILLSEVIKFTLKTYRRKFGTDFESNQISCKIIFVTSYKYQSHYTYTTSIYVLICGLTSPV